MTPKERTIGDKITYAVLIAMIIAFFAGSSCTKDNVLQLVAPSSIKTNFELYTANTAKVTYNVPLCYNDKTPVYLQYILLDNNDAIWTETVPVDSIVTFPEGNYSIEDISVLSIDNYTLYRVPNRESIVWDYSGYVDISTPFDITLYPYETITLDVEMLCYSIDMIDVTQGLDSNIKLTDLRTIWYLIPNANICVDTVTITIDGILVWTMDINRTGLFNAPIHPEFNEIIITAWEGNRLVQSYSLSEYNTDNNLDNNDIIVFNTLCP